MSILNVNQIQPVGGGNTITVGSSNIDYSGSITGNISVDGNLTVTGVVSNEDVTNIDSVGIITARSDVSIADKIVHTGDTNTAIRFPAADTFAVETAGSERLRVTSTGDLDFKSADGVGINFRESGYINIDSDNDDSSRNFTFYDAKGTGSEKHLMILTDTGNVGIATNNTTYANSNANDLVIGSSSSSTERGITLGSSVASAIRFADAGNSSAGMIQYVHNAGGTDYMNFYTSATERLRITSSGDVGIGTISPARSPLHIHKSGSDVYLHLTNSTTGSGSGDGFTIHQSGVETLLNNRETGNMRLYTSGTERLRITSTGGVHFNNAELIERVNIVANKLSAATSVNLDNGMVHYYTTNETATANPNIITTAGINTNMATGDTMSVTIMSKPNSAGYFPRISIDGLLTGITTYWSGGSAPSSAESSGVDVNVYQIIKTADATYDVIANTSNFA